VLFVGFFAFALNGMPRDWGALPGWLLGQAAPAAANSDPNWPALAPFADWLAGRGG
jgi:hypothetical protein